ncbi:MAG: hypothetical protein K8I27_06780 [Planctomycetes bacterium]|nr:hypothetical protein [Planctomycetota bacterium]
MPSPDQVLESMVEHTRKALAQACILGPSTRPLDPLRCQLPRSFMGAMVALAFVDHGGFAPGVHGPGGPWGRIDCAWDETHVWMIEHAKLDSLWCLRDERHSVIAHATRLTDLERLVRIAAYLSPELRARPLRLTMLLQIWAADEAGFAALEWARTCAAGAPINMGWDNEPAPELEGWKIHAPRHVCNYCSTEVWLTMMTCDLPPCGDTRFDKFEVPSFHPNQEARP